jgi:hypothetical protein
MLVKHVYDWRFFVDLFVDTTMEMPYARNEWIYVDSQHRTVSFSCFERSVLDSGLHQSFYFMVEVGSSRWE